MIGVSSCSTLEVWSVELTTQMKRIAAVNSDMVSPHFIVSARILGLELLRLQAGLQTARFAERSLSSCTYSSCCKCFGVRLARAYRLNKLKTQTATLSTKTLPDLLRILRLPPICDGRNANAKGTVFFTAPLYRPNLHYKVLTKPASAKAAIESMGKWIQATHPYVPISSHR